MADWQNMLIQKPGKHGLKRNQFSRFQMLIFLFVFGVIGIVIYRSFAASNPNLPGDLNNDNTVNIQDLSILLSNYGTTNSTADINSDGTVNVLDLSVLLSHFGSSYTPPSTGLYFGSNSVWNTPIGSGSVPATLDPNSSNWVNSINSIIGGVNINQGDYTPTLFTADASTPRYTYKQGDGWITDSVPIPSGFRVSPGDGWGIVVDNSTNRIYAFSGQPTITSATTATGLSGNIVGPYDINGPGTWNDNTGPWIGGASGISYIAGAITPNDVKAGVINHALSLSLPKSLNRSEGYAGVPACTGSYVYPASSSDGTGGCTTVPVGTHFQLDPSLTDTQLLGLGADQGDLIVLHALQKFGAYDRDSTANLIALYAANNLLTPGGSTWGYPSAWSNGLPKAIATHLRVLAAPTGTYDSVSTYGQPHK
jgi:hypothetical protein